MFVESGDAREVHDFSTLLGFGVDGVCPYLAYEVLAHINNTGDVEARSGTTFSNEELFYKYRKASAKGILKVMSKMGISTLQSYKGAQVFEALGLNDAVMDLCFTGTSSRIKGEYIYMTNNCYNKNHYLKLIYVFGNITRLELLLFLS